MNSVSVLWFINFPSLSEFYHLAFVLLYISPEIFGKLI